MTALKVDHVDSMLQNSTFDGMRFWKYFKSETKNISHWGAKKKWKSHLSLTFLSTVTREQEILDSQFAPDLPGKVKSDLSCIAEYKIVAP